MGKWVSGQVGQTRENPLLPKAHFPKALLPNPLDCACHSAICSPEKCSIAHQIRVGLSRIRCPKQ